MYLSNLFYKNDNYIRMFSCAYVCLFIFLHLLYEIQWTYTIHILCFWINILMNRNFVPFICEFILLQKKRKSRVNNLISRFFIFIFLFFWLEKQIWLPFQFFHFNLLFAFHPCLLYGIRRIQKGFCLHIFILGRNS